MPQLTAAALYVLEGPRPRNITVEELLTLAYALDVAPVHLLVPVDAAEIDAYRATPNRSLPVRLARQWVRGYWCPSEVDPRIYYGEVPRDEFGTQSQDERVSEVAEGHEADRQDTSPPGRTRGNEQDIDDEGRRSE